ncbi:hypothetical protein C0J52_24242, partial [Blattella germanica]
NNKTVLNSSTLWSVNKYLKSSSKNPLWNWKGNPPHLHKHMGLENVQVWTKIKSSIGCKAPPQCCPSLGSLQSQTSRKMPGDEPHRGRAELLCCLDCDEVKLMQQILYTAAAPTGKSKIIVNNRKQERGGAIQPSA